MRGLKEKMKMQDASVTDGVQYRKASLFDMIASVATNGGQMCFYILIMYASYIYRNGRVWDCCRNCRSHPIHH